MARFARTLIQDDGSEVISSIFESTQSQETGELPHGRLNNVTVGHQFEVPHGVKIGMIRGGPQERVGEWGWPLRGQGTTRVPTKEEIAADAAQVEARTEVAPMKRKHGDPAAQLR